MSTHAETSEQITSSFLSHYKVMLHNDTIHAVDEVIQALVASVPVSAEEAERITMTAHQEGRAVVIECRKEEAEYYKERLESYGLTITIEPAQSLAVLRALLCCHLPGMPCSYESMRMAWCS